MTYAERFTGVPQGWEKLTEGAYTRAHEATWQALGHELAVDRLAAYYSRDGDFAGATFLTVGPCDP